MRVNDYDDEPKFHNPSYNNNRLLIEDPNDQYVRSGGGPSVGNRGLAPRRDLGPLIEEEPDVSDPDLSMSLGMPKLQEMANAKKHAAARKIFNTRMHNNVAANPWTKLGQRTEKNVYGMFGEKPRDFEGTARLFGRKAGNFRSAERQRWKGLGFFGRLKRAVKGEPGAPKRTWMERLFGARKKSQDLTRNEKAAFTAQGKGRSWADALAPLEADGSAKLEDWKDGDEEQKEEGAGVGDGTPSTQPVAEEIKESSAPNQAQMDEKDSLLSQELNNQQDIEEEEKEGGQNEENSLDGDSIYEDENDDDEELSPAQQWAREQAIQNIKKIF